MKRKAGNLSMPIFEYLERKKEEHYIEAQRRQCQAGVHTRFYNTTVIIDTHGGSRDIVIGDHSHVKGELLTLGHGGRIQIGEWSYVGPNTHIWSGKKITIGDRVLIGPNCCIFDNDIHPIDAEMRHRQFMDIVSIGQPGWVQLNDEEVIIENDAWIGANVVVLKGVRVGKGAIVGAGSVVIHDIPDYAVAHGNPAQMSRKIEN